MIWLFYEIYPSLSMLSALFIVICLIISLGKHKMMTETKLPGLMLLICASTPS